MVDVIRTNCVLWFKQCKLNAICWLCLSYGMTHQVMMGEQPNIFITSLLCKFTMVLYLINCEFIALLNDLKLFTEHKNRSWQMSLFYLHSQKVTGFKKCVNMTCLHVIILWQASVFFIYILTYAMLFCFLVCFAFDPFFYFV